MGSLRPRYPLFVFATILGLSGPKSWPAGRALPYHSTYNAATGLARVGVLLVAVVIAIALIIANLAYLGYPGRLSGPLKRLIGLLFCAATFLTCANMIGKNLRLLVFTMVALLCVLLITNVVMFMRLGSGHAQV